VATKDPGPALHEGFRLTYPSGTVVMAFYAGRRAPGRVRVTHPMATVEVVEAPS
jgi:hypothetical protein